MHNIIFSVALVAATVGLCVAAPADKIKPKLLYILLDGFRHDYAKDLPADRTAGFQRIFREGVRAKHVVPVFPSFSYPSWTTLSTGLHPESHGIVGNHFYDAKDKDYFTLFNETATGKSKWWTAEPIWTTATKSGLRVALLLWSRCDVAFAGVLPEYCEHFVKIPGGEIFRTNVDKALGKLDEGFDVVHIYTEHVDNTGHKYGPDSDQRKQAVVDIDETLVHLFQQLDKRNLTDTVNIVIASDHGMTSTSPSTTTRLEMDEFLPEDVQMENIAGEGAFSNLKLANAQDLEKTYAKLSKMKNVNVYKKGEIPDELHYQKSPFIHELILSAEIGTYLNASNKAAMLPPRRDYIYQGQHGYQPHNPDMHTIFFARGPAFKKDVVLDPIHIVDIYQVLTRVLSITSQPHNGTWASVAPAFAGVDAACVPALGVMATALMAVFTLAR